MAFDLDRRLGLLARLRRWRGAFRTRLVLRVILLGGTLWLLVLLLDDMAYPAAALLVGALALYQLVALVHLVDRTNRELARFFAAVKYTDFSQTFPSGGLDTSFNDLNASFNQVLDAFRQARAAKEEQARYLQTVVQHIGIGLVVHDGDGRVSLINSAAKRLLGVPRLVHIADLQNRSQMLATAMQDLGPRGRDLVQLEDLQLALEAAVFRLGSNEHTLVSLYDIGNVLDEKEMEAWQNLIRVLTHEIMNSITPIASLASTAGQLLESGEPDAETSADIRTAVATIQRRSEGLLHFVEAYRGLTRLPAPSFERLPVAELFARVGQLLQPQFAAAQVALHIRVDPPGLDLIADPTQLEQVLINLLHNALQACSQTPAARVDLGARLMGGKVVVEVADNGVGIVAEALDQIFIPFFTTKPEGSGIGLSLCRQIMRLHGGSIAVRSKPQSETIFTLRF
ncbi:MAG: GHKL domain-containing protein [Candidatus Latescibacteria bacterium]|nr:GHKL domain-containing protein [Candidatus Latescibacterota bacterium]